MTDFSSLKEWSVFFRGKWMGYTRAESREQAIEIVQLKTGHPVGGRLGWAAR
jgi:hypothetical protein